MAGPIDLTAALRTRIRTFIFRFGLLHDAQTPCGLPLPVSHAHALSVLLERELARQSTRQKELAQSLGLDKSSITRLCRRMARSGHVVQAQSDRDGRAREVRLTARGVAIAREVDTASRARFDRVLCAIPRTRRAPVIEALAVLNAAVAALEPEGSPS